MVMRIYSIFRGYFIGSVVESILPSSRFYNFDSNKMRAPPAHYIKGDVSI